VVFDGWGQAERSSDDVEERKGVEEGESRRESTILLHWRNLRLDMEGY